MHHGPISIRRSGPSGEPKLEKRGLMFPRIKEINNVSFIYLSIYIYISMDVYIFKYIVENC